VAELAPKAMPAKRLGVHPILPMRVCWVLATSKAARGVPVAPIRTPPATLSFPLKLLFPASCGILVVSRLRVTLPLVPPPVRSVPAVTLVMVPFPVPGNFCPVANVRMPVLLIFNPVSAGWVEPEPNNKFSVPKGLVVLLPAGSAFH